MASVVYWIAHKSHTDMFSQGYIGVSNNHESRWKYHSRYGENTHMQHAIKKYGWDNLQKKVILIAEKNYCLDIEAKLRPKDKIGWNIVAGGGNPPSIPWNKGKTMPQETLKKLKAKGFGFKKGHKAWNLGIKLNEEQKSKQFNIAEYMKDKPNPMAGKSMLPHVVEAARQTNLGKTASEETKRKMSLANKGRVFPKIICPHCQKTGGVTGMKKWHFDKCKFKEIT